MGQAVVTLADEECPSPEETDRDRSSDRVMVAQKDPSRVAHFMQAAQYRFVISKELPPPP